MSNAHSTQTHRDGGALQAPNPTESHLHALGEELLARTEEVVARIVAASAGSQMSLDDAVEKRFERVGALSTQAVGAWMAGERLEVVREVGMEVWKIFGQLAAQHAAELKAAEEKAKWTFVVMPGVEVKKIKLQRAA